MQHTCIVNGLTTLLVLISQYIPLIITWWALLKFVCYYHNEKMHTTKTTVYLRPSIQTILMPVHVKAKSVRYAICGIIWTLVYIQTKQTKKRIRGSQYHLKNQKLNHINIFFIIKNHLKNPDRSLGSAPNVYKWVHQVHKFTCSYINTDHLLGKFFS